MVETTYIFFGVTIATERRQARHVRQAFTRKRITRSMRTTERITAPRASQRVEPCAGPCVAPFHTCMRNTYTVYG
jgi:hypothetical protein